MLKYTTHHTSAAGAYGIPPTKSCTYEGEVPQSLITGDWKNDAEIIFGHAWPGRGGRFRAREEGYNFHSMQHTDTGIIFCMDINNRPGYFMWIDGYFPGGPW